MGYYKNHRGIECFEPDNTETTLYIKTGISWMAGSLEELLDRIQTHFKVETVILDDFEIHSEYIHTNCIGYDRYDPSDYTNYLVITKKA